MRSLVVIIVIALIGCGTHRAEVHPSRGGLVVIESVDLPPPVRTGGAPLTEALAQRRSVRNYTTEALDETELSQLLWSAQGLTSDVGQRTAPSAGGLYPLELYSVTPDWHSRYDPVGHRLEILGAEDRREALSRAALDQTAVAEAPVVFVIAAVYARTEPKYGDRAERYVLLEAGHAAQNLLLQATASELAAVPIGAFDDDKVQQLLGLPPDHEPLYLIPVGHPVP